MTTTKSLYPVKLTRDQNKTAAGIAHAAEVAKKVFGTLAPSFDLVSCVYNALPEDASPSEYDEVIQALEASVTAAKKIFHTDSPNGEMISDLYDLLFGVSAEHETAVSLDKLTSASTVAYKLFGDRTVTGVLGVYQRVFCFDDESEEDQAVAELRTAHDLAKKVFGAGPTAPETFLFLDAVWPDPVDSDDE